MKRGIRVKDIRSLKLKFSFILLFSPLLFLLWKCQNVCRGKKKPICYSERETCNSCLFRLFDRETLNWSLNLLLDHRVSRSNLKPGLVILEKLGNTTFLKTTLLIIGHGTWRGFHKLLTWDVDITAGSIEQELPLWTGTSGPRWVEQTHKVTGHSQAGIRCCGDRTKRAVRQKEQWDKKSSETKRDENPSVRPEVRTAVCLWKVCLFFLGPKRFTAVLKDVYLLENPQRLEAKSHESLHTSPDWIVRDCGRHNFSVSNWIASTLTCSCDWIQ